ncbi:MAG TPA: hypothetical protein VGE27_14840 [Gemmatimonas sp.]|uniref:COG1470 family protein n=1 Tax=Gemmatimonas sp. TaxID=1962908 RepID=UPI002ED94701
MSASFRLSLLARRVRALAGLSLLSACGGGGDETPVTPPPPPQPSGSFTLSVLAPLSVTAGQSGTATVVITRVNGFTGEVTVAAPSTPAGITASVTGSPTTLTGVSVTVSVASTVAAGSYAIPLRATATGLAEQSASIAVTVTAAQPAAFTMTVDPVEFELPAGNGWTANGIVSIVRNAGFTGAVNVSVTGLSGATGAVVATSPSSIAATETASNLTALTLEGAAPGVYTGTVRATATGFGEQTATVRVRVSAPSTGTVRWTFCNASRVPRFFAVRDGSGAWRHIVPAGPAAATTGNPTTFSFTPSQSTAGIAMVSLGEKTSASPLIQGFRWDVFYLTAQEVVEQAAAECVRWPDVTTRTATATVSGYQSFDAMVGSASRFALVNTGSTGTASTTLTASNLKAGSFDLFLTRSSFTGGVNTPIVPQGIILRRALDPASGTVLPALNFGTEGFAPTVSTVSYGNTNGESFFVAQNFLTTNGLNGLFNAVASYAQTARPWYGVPASRLQAGDLHQIVATTSTAAARRSVIAFADQVSTRMLDFGPVLPTPTVSAGAPAAPWLIRATGTVPTEYNARAALYLRETIADPRAFMITASRGYLGGAGTYDLAIPDLSSATGFTAFWNARRGAALRWTVTGGEGDPGSSEETFCIQVGICAVKAVSGAVYKSAQATGTVTVP